jgi:DNA-binding response OmpR family regulator
VSTNVARILIADDDTAMLRTLSIVLERRGHRVETVADGAAAYRSAIAEPPDLLITDVLMPHVDGWTLVRRLRERLELATLPVIFMSALSSDEDRMRGFRLGADGYLTKPFRYEELDLRVTGALRRTSPRRRDPQGSGPTVLHGVLDQIAVATVLMLVEQERKTGRLTARRPDGVTIEVLVREGRIIQARRADGAEAPDRACLDDLLGWDTGVLELSACAVDGPDRVQASVTQLLLQAAVTRDESTR